MKNLQKFLEPKASQNSGIHQTIYVDYGKAREDRSLEYHCTSTPHRSETDGNAERAVRKVKKVHPRYFCSPAWMKIGGLVPWNLASSAKRSKPCMGLENSLRTVFWKTIWWTSNSCWNDGTIASDFCERPVKSPIW